MKMAPSTAQNFAFRVASIAFGEPGAKQSQGEKPCNDARFSRTVAVDYSLWSHLSLHSRQGIKASLARPLLARPPSPRSSPLGLSGSGVRYDETHLAARPPESEVPSRQTLTNPRRWCVASMSHIWVSTGHGRV